MAAVLHDTVEDTMTTEQELVRHFGKEVADIVIEVTDDKALPKAERKRLQVAHAPHISRRARLVKLADKICNLRDITMSPPADWSVERKREYFDWGKAVVEAIARRASRPRTSVRQSLRSPAVRGRTAARQRLARCCSRTRPKGKLLGLHRVWSERPRVAGRYFGCYVGTTVSGDSSDHALASDADLRTCLTGTRGVIILLHSLSLRGSD